MRAAGSLRNARLKLEANPFLPGTGGLRTGRPLQTALGELIRFIGLETPVVVVAGSAGTGKTLLVDMASKALSGMGLIVRRVDRGDLMPIRLRERVDVLLIDEADCISDTALQALLPKEGTHAATTMVFMCLPASVHRFSSVLHPAVVQLQAMSVVDARNYLLERAASIGRLNLFTPEAADLLVNGSHGLPRLLRSIADRAFVSAALEGASEITLKHVAQALASRAIPSAGERIPPPHPSAEPPARAQEQPAALDRRPPKLVPAKTDALRQRSPAKAAAAPAEEPGPASPLSLPAAASVLPAHVLEPPREMASPEDGLPHRKDDEEMAKVEPPPVPVSAEADAQSFAAEPTGKASAPPGQTPVPAADRPASAEAEPKKPAMDAPAELPKEPDKEPASAAWATHSGPAVSGSAADSETAKVLPFAPRSRSTPSNDRAGRRRGEAAGRRVRVAVYAAVVVSAALAAAAAPRLLPLASVLMHSPATLRLRLEPPPPAVPRPAPQVGAGNATREPAAAAPVLPSTKPTTSNLAPSAADNHPVAGLASPVGRSPSSAPMDELPEGELYGRNNRNSHLTLRVHKRMRVVVLGRNDRVLLMRTLEPGDRYRVPALPNVTITVPDAGAIETLVDDVSTGFVGEPGMAANHLPLQR